MARPSIYSTDLVAELCSRMAEGRSLRSVCKDEDMPNASTVFRWLQVKPEFCEQYTRAREASADAIVEEMLDIADDGTNDWMEKLGEKGENIGWRENGEAISRSKLRVETRKWIASKLKAKKYGDKLSTEITGKDGKPFVPEMSDFDLARRVAYLLESALVAAKDGAKPPQSEWGTTQ